MVFENNRKSDYIETLFGENPEYKEWAKCNLDENELDINGLIFSGYYKYLTYLLENGREMELKNAIEALEGIFVRADDKLKNYIVTEIFWNIEKGSEIYNQLEPNLKNEYDKWDKKWDG